MAEQVTSLQATNLADLLERVLDKGVVIIGDIKIGLVEVELLTIKIRLLITSVDKAKSLGINWWENDPFLHAPDFQKVHAADFQKMAAENAELKQRLVNLEKKSPKLSQKLSQ